MKGRAGPPGRRKKPSADGVRTTISLTQVVDKWAEEMMESRGFDNFSAYVADLIRRDKERDDERKRSGKYPSNPDQGVFTEEKPKTKYPNKPIDLPEPPNPEKQ